MKLLLYALNFLIAFGMTRQSWDRLVGEDYVFLAVIICGISSIVLATAITDPLYKFLKG